MAEDDLERVQKILLDPRGLIHLFADGLLLLNLPPFIKNGRPSAEPKRIYINRNRFGIGLYAEKRRQTLLDDVAYRMEFDSKFPDLRYFQENGLSDLSINNPVFCSMVDYIFPRVFEPEIKAHYYDGRIIDEPEAIFSEQELDQLLIYYAISLASAYKDDKFTDMFFPTVFLRDANSLLLLLIFIRGEKAQNFIQNPELDYLIIYLQHRLEKPGDSVETSGSIEECSRNIVNKSDISSYPMAAMWLEAFVFRILVDNNKLSNSNVLSFEISDPVTFPDPDGPRIPGPMV